MHTKSETMAALTLSKLHKMLKVIDIDTVCRQRLWSYDLTALYKSIIIIIIVGIVNFTFSSPLFIYDGSLTVLFRSVTRSVRNYLCRASYATD